MEELEQITEETEKTYTQAEVERIVQARLDRERRKMPSKEELADYRQWKDTRAEDQGRLDDLNKQLVAVAQEKDQLQRENYVLKKGITGDKAEFIAFKASRMVDEHTTYEQAVDILTQKEEEKVTFDWAASLAGNAQEQPQNVMNDLIRAAFR